MTQSIAIIGDSGIAFDARVQRLVKSFASNNYKVDLFLPNTSGNQSIKDFFENNLVRIFIYDLKITRLNKNLLFWKKFQNAHITVLKTGVNYDFIYINDYPLLYEGVRLKSELKSKLIYDSHEIYVETINQFYKTSKGLKGRFFSLWIKINKWLHERQERKLIIKVDFMITVSASFCQYFLNKYGVKTLLLKNGPINVKHLNRRDFFREKLNIPQSSKILLYQGVFNSSRGLEKLVKSANFFDRHIQLILLGGGPLENDLKLLSENSENIHFHPMVSQDDLFEYTSSADIGILIIEAKNKSKELTLPNKVFEYMSAGIPFITNFLPEGASIVKKHDCGFIIQDETPEIIAQEINRIFKEEFVTKGFNGFDAINKEYLWNIDFDNMIKHLTNLN